MTDKEVPEIADIPPPQASPRNVVVIVLCVVLGVLVLALAGGGVLHIKALRALRAEIAVVKQGLKERLRGQEEMQQQIEGLARELQALKTVSTADNAPEVAQDDKPASAVKIEPVISMAPTSKEVVRTSVKGEAASNAPGGRLGCDIFGKPAAEQAAILKRCVEVMDAPPKAKPAGK